MNIEDFIMGIIYIVALGCVLYYINKFQMDKLKRNSKPINKVHFYVARDKIGTIWLYMGKPKRDKCSFCSNESSIAIISSTYFSKCGLNANDYVDLKWEDEPVEVFINMED